MVNVLPFPAAADNTWIHLWTHFLRIPWTHHLHLLMSFVVWCRSSSSPYLCLLFSTVFNSQSCIGYQWERLEFGCCYHHHHHLSTYCLAIHYLVERIDAWMSKWVCDDMHSIIMLKQFPPFFSHVKPFTPYVSSYYFVSSLFLHSLVFFLGVVWWFLVS